MDKDEVVREPEGPEARGWRAAPPSQEVVLAAPFSVTTVLIYFRELTE